MSTDSPLETFDWERPPLVWNTEAQQCERSWEDEAMRWGPIEDIQEPPTLSSYHEQWLRSIVETPQQFEEAITRMAGSAQSTEEENNGQI